MRALILTRHRMRASRPIGLPVVTAHRVRATCCEPEPIYPVSAQRSRRCGKPSGTWPPAFSASRSPDRSPKAAGRTGTALERNGQTYVTPPAAGQLLADINTGVTCTYIDQGPATSAVLTVRCPPRTAQAPIAMPALGRRIIKILNAARHQSLHARLQIVAQRGVTASTVSVKLVTCLVRSLCEEVQLPPRPPHLFPTGPAGPEQRLARHDRRAVPFSRPTSASRSKASGPRTQRSSP